MRSTFQVCLLIALLWCCFKWGSASEQVRMQHEHAKIHFRSDLVKLAESFLDSPYRSGGSHPPSGFDCSGFTHFVFGQKGIQLNKHSAAQSEQGNKVELESCQAGDLIFFKRPHSERVFHVAMIISNIKGRPKIIHSTSSRGVVIDDLMASSYWRSKIWEVRDVVVASESGI
ncbi:MAG: C40 family peptidase [Bacteroidota bacterium]